MDVDYSDTLPILRQLERGEIDAQQADERLSVPAVRRIEHEPVEEIQLPSWVRQLWIYGLAAGMLITAFGAWIIVATVHANVLWLLCGLPILLCGSLVLALAGGMPSGHWLYVNIQEGRRRRPIQFAVPLPLGLARVGLWLAHWFGRGPRSRFRFHEQQIDLNMSWADADAFLSALERELANRRGLAVDVDEGDERVQVYLV